MILRNSTNSELSIQFEGAAYSLGANQTRDYPEAVARHWKDKIHQFLVEEKDELKPAKEVKQEVIPESEEKKEEKVEESTEITEEKEESPIDAPKRGRGRPPKVN